MNRKVLFLSIAVSLLFATLVFAGVKVLTAQADIPSVVSASFHDVDSTTWLDVVIIHRPPPSIGASHYVSVVQLEINGTTVNLTQVPQSPETFTVQYSLGPNSDTYSIRARALCNLHGYGAWSGAPTPTPTPSIEPTPTPTSSPSQSPTPPSSPTPSLEPTSTPTGFLPTEALIITAIAAIGIVAAAVILFLKKRKK